MSNIHEIAMRLHLRKWFHGTPVADAGLAADLKAMRDALTVEAVTGPSDEDFVTSLVRILETQQSDPEDSRYDDGRAEAWRIWKQIQAVMPPVAAPADGFKQVPVEPTPEMMNAATKAYEAASQTLASYFPERAAYRAMLAAAPALAAATPAAVAHDGAAEVAEPTYLCQAWGETDFPAAALVKGRDAVRQFLIEQWTGTADHTNADGGNTVDLAMMDMREEWEAEGPAWKWSVEFEIGGVSVQQVADFSPADRSQRPAASQAHGNSEAVAESASDEATQPFYDLAWAHHAQQHVSFAGDELESLTFVPADFEKFCLTLIDCTQRPAAPAAVAPLAEVEDLNRDLLLTTLHVIGLGKFRGAARDDAHALANAIRDALGGSQGEAARPVAWWIPAAEQFCLAKKDGSRPFAKAWQPLYAIPQPAPVAEHATTDGPAPALTETALAWWEGHRPFDWSEAQHLKDPAVNCTSMEAADLAKACAALQAGKGGE